MTIKKIAVKRKKKVIKVKKPKLKLFGNRIKEVMQEQHMVGQELADLMGTNGGHLSRIINGQRLCLTLPVALKMSQILKTPIKDLFFLTKEDQAAFRGSPTPALPKGRG